MIDPRRAIARILLEAALARVRQGQDPALAKLERQQKGRSNG
jgi:hypothetical protein